MVKGFLTAILSRDYMGKKTVKNTTSKRNGPDARNVADSGKLGVHLAQTAWRVAVPFLLFSIGGIMLDKNLDTEPIFSLLGLLLAVASVTAVVYKYVDKHFPDTFGGRK